MNQQPQQGRRPKREGREEREVQPSQPFERVLDARLICSIVAAGIMSFSGVVVETAMNVTFPTLMQEFGVGTSTVQWMTTAYLLVLAAIVPTSGFLNRRFKTKHIFMLAMAFYISGIVCGASAISFPMLLCGRILEGTGTGIALPLMFNIIQEQAPKKQMGLMMGIGSLVTALAPAVGPSVGGWIAENLGWRWIFLCLLPILIAAFFMGTFSIRQSHRTARERFDARGWICLVASFTCLVFATSEAGTSGFTSPLVLGLLAGFVVLLLLFAWLEEHQKEPLIHLSIFGDARFTLSLLTIVFMQFIVLSLSFLLPNYSQLVMGHGAAEAGSILLPGCLLGAALSPISGRILDRFGAARPILCGCVAELVACILFRVTAHGLETLGAILIYMVYTLGQGLMVGNTMTSALSFLPAGTKPDGNAAINTLQQLAGAVGTSVVTAIVNEAQAGLQSGTGAFAAATMAGSATAYGLLVVMAVVPLVMQLVVFCVLRRQRA